MTTRNANIYTSRITPGLYLSAFGNTKPTDEIERAYAIQVDNGTDAAMDVRLSINAPGVVASFAQPRNGVPLLTWKDIKVPPLSSAAHTVFVGKTDAAKKYPRVEVVAERRYVTPYLRASVILNGDPSNPTIRDDQVDVDANKVTKKDTHNPRVENPRVENKTQENSPVKNPRVENPRVENPRVENPRVENPRVENTTVETPRVENPRVENPRVENSSYSDVTYEVTNDGNTTSSFEVDVRTTVVDTTGYNYQLLGWRSYQTPTLKNDCTVGFTEDQQVLFDLRLEAGDFGGGGLPLNKKPSMVVRPGETVYWTLRAINNTGVGAPGTNEQFCAVYQCVPISGGSPGVLTTVVAAQAPNTGETAPRVSVFGPGPAIRPPTLPLPVAIVDEPYGPLNFFGEGGATPYTWQASGLPPGIGLDLDAGVLSGTPSETGIYPFQVTLWDSNETSVTQSFTLSVQNAAPGDILVTDDGYPAGRIVRVSRDGTSSSVLANLSSHPMDIAVRPSGGYVVVQRSRISSQYPTPTPHEVSLVTSVGTVSTLISFDNCDVEWDNCPTAAVSVAADASGNIYVGDNGDDRITVSPRHRTANPAGRRPPSISRHRLLRMFCRA